MSEYQLDERKSITSLLYICNSLGGAWDKYALLKILYFAERKHLLRYGRPISGDKIIAMDFGPVPSFSYDKVKEKALGGKKYFDYKEYAVIALVAPNLDFLAESEIECLDESIAENKHLGFGDLKRKSHDEAYDLARKKGKNAVMSYIDIAKAAGANQEMINYICEKIELNAW